MHDIVGSYQLGMSIEFLNTVMTTHSINLGNIEFNEFLKINDIRYNPQTEIVEFDFEVHREILH